MTSKRVFFVMIGALVLLTAAIGGGAYAGSQMLSSKAKTLSDKKLQSKVFSQEQTSLVKAKKDVAKYQSLETIAKTIVPQDKDQAEAVREITNLAAQSGITLSSITLPSSTLGASPTGSTSKSTTSPSISATSKADLTQLKSVKGIPGVYTLEITVATDTGTPVSYSSFIDFLSRLEQNRRTSQVSTINLQPFPKDPSQVSFTLTIDEYIKP